MQNEKPSEAIKYLEKSLENSYFSSDKDFRVTVYTLSVIIYIQSNNLDSAEECCRQALKCQSPTNISIQADNLLAEIPQLKIIVKYQNPDYARQFVRASFQFFSTVGVNHVTEFEYASYINRFQTSTYDELITFADHYRHQQNYTRASTYYSKAVKNMTEIDSKLTWNVYRKMVRMKHDDEDRYQYHVIEQYSKYDDDNPKHFEIIATLQIIMYKYCLTQNEHNLAFDCLIQGIFMKIKCLYHQISIDSKYI
ncbi:unnamed protein product [Rotaria sp. Silwood2]|nr:unnamed protein product [Rotaria sp. Silwood2]CAF3857045.1 unnamed protein product [Rotaria sp. Silwood2]